MTAREFSTLRLEAHGFLGCGGYSADIVVFNVRTIRDRSTFGKSMEPSVGVRYLVAGGAGVVEEGLKIAKD